jgi:hypothetical protein
LKVRKGANNSYGDAKIGTKRRSELTEIQGDDESGETQPKIKNDTDGLKKWTRRHEIMDLTNVFRSKNYENMW